ncbi:indoleamine 2,3-dioxygenase 1 [Mitosporidium daphniae]|uniref:Indoleamine 2,3-dioxygenase 1 n=1 Tax=Mitosporidium daphniae TaxID=1485682 RepID=A0A098VU90_9MICR|nr:indoleamine 2,3-dioxygenase 1 [Mitosporidium daphniae]KGG52542.1 indoleamine 2,3-dioxygenase 1 [Mitosporidium daphniae]|eukprot:XP_013239015.1 indoleamine 2,3-dioxygenase 1 [Mitosporidium daphniae]
MISVAYVNGNSTTDPLLTLLPDNLSGPWIEISKHFDFEPVLNYASSVQFNWHSPTKKDINSVKLEDIEICSTITGSLTEVWFYQVSLAIELESIRIVPIIKNIFSILNSNHNEAKEKIEVQLGNLLNSLKEIGMLLERIHEHCVPSVFYNGLRPYLSGWNTPGFDKMGGLKFGSAPDAPIYTSTGGSAAQSPLIQVLDALFGVRHLPNPDGSPNYLYLIRKYMPKADRDLILWVESWGEGFKDFCVENQIYHPFIDCLSQMISNRQLHGGIVWKFIKQEAMKLKKDTEAVGTGGTPYEKFLKSIIGSTQMLKDAFQKKFAILHN